MSRDIIAPLIYVGFLIVYIEYMRRLSKRVGKIYAQLDAFWKEAQQTNDILQLKDINERLIAFAKKNCWHRKMSDYARKINHSVVSRAKFIDISLKNQ